MNRRRFAASLSWLAALAGGRLPVRALPLDVAPSLDLIGDPIPTRALARLGTTRFHARPIAFPRVESMAVSPDGRLIAVANLHDPVVLWDAITGRVVRRLGQGPARPAGYSYSNHAVAFSPDGLTLAVGRPGREVARAEIRSDRGIIRPGGKIERWEVRTGRPLTPFGGHDDPVVGIAYSADGSTLVTADRRGLILVRDPSTGEVDRCLQHIGEARRSAVLTAIALTADGLTLATCGDGYPVNLWDVHAGARIRSLIVADDSGSPNWEQVALSPDGAVIAALGRAGIEVWDATSGEHRRSIAPGPDYGDEPGHPERFRHWFTALALTADGRTLATAGIDDNVRLWDLATGNESARFDPVDGTAVGVGFGPGEGSLVVVGSRGTVRAWDLPARTARVRTDGHQAAVAALAFSADGRTLVSVGDDAVCLSAAGTGRMLRREPWQPHRWREWELAPDGSRLAFQESGYDRRITLIEVPSGAVIQHFDQFRQDEYGSIYFCFAADGRTLVVLDEVGDDLVFVFLDLASGREVRRVVSTGWDRGAEELDRYGRPALLPGGRTLVSLASLRGNDDSIVLHDAISGRFLRRFVAPMKADGRFARSFGVVVGSPDGSLLAATEDDVVRIYEVERGREVGRLAGPELDSRSTLAFAPGGRVIATGSGTRGEVGTIVLWDVATGRALTRLDGHEGPITALAFAPDGRRLASGSKDTTVLVWDVASWTG